MSLITVTIEEPFQILGSVVRDSFGDLQALSLQIVVLIDGRHVSLKPIYHHERAFVTDKLIEAFEKEQCRDDDYAEAWREDK